MLTFCDRILNFYPKEILKISKRIAYFERARDVWLARGDGDMGNPPLPALPVDEEEGG